MLINNIQINTHEIIENTKKILVVTDNINDTYILSNIFNELDIEYIFINNELTEQLHNQKFNLCIIDADFSEKNNFKIYKKLKHNKKTSNLPFIFITTKNKEHKLINYFKMGAYINFEKPFNKDIISLQLKNILEIEDFKENKTKEMEHFVATLTHDLKSPINAEICALKLMLQKPKLDKTEMLTELLNSANYMKLITDKILCFYKQKSNTTSIKKEKNNFIKIIESSIAELNYLAIDKQIKINFTHILEDDTVYADSIELKRVINNLLSNAIEYSYNYSTIDIFLTKLDDKYIFSIKDYGVGLNIQKNTDIFEEYVSLANKYKKIGFGLGLNICKKIINLHNGNIKLESKEHQGTKITFTIPIK